MDDEEVKVIVAELTWRDPTRAGYRVTVHSTHIYFGFQCQGVRLMTKPKTVSLEKARRHMPNRLLVACLHCFTDQEAVDAGLTD